MSDINFSDFFGLGKGIEKLVDVISKGVGRITKSHFERKDIKTKALELEMLMKLDAEGMKMIAETIKNEQAGTGGIKYKNENLQISSAQNLPHYDQLTLTQRAAQRNDFQDLKKQHNIESITSLAAEQLKDDNDINNGTIDEDWITRFFRIIEDVSNDEMQHLWAKVLAGEIKRPKTYSLRTLDLVRNLTEEEAKVIMKLADYAIESNETIFLLRGHSNEMLKMFGIPHADVSLLIELGIIHPDREAVLTLHKNQQVAAADFIAGKHIISALRNLGGPTFTIPIYSFTRPGREILSLLDINPPIEYLNQLSRMVSDKSVIIRYSEVKIENDRRRHAYAYKDFYEIYDELKNKWHAENSGR
jgi:uncharacterized repeat protein (TIGR03899 family)